MRGLFLCVEGIDGTGKTGLRDVLVHLSRSKNFETFPTREPGGTPFAEKIRDLIKADRDEEVSPLTETLLFFASRAHHVESIRKWVNEGKVVICDRFVDSTYAYQSAGGGVCYSFLESLSAEVVGDMLPDLTIVLTVDIDEGRRRAAARGMLDVMDSKPREYYVKAQAEFIELAYRDPGRYVIIDTNKPQQDVFDEAVDFVGKFINDHIKSHHLK